MQVVAHVEGDRAAFESARDDVATEHAIVGEEVQVMAGHLEARGGVGEAEADDRAGCVFHPPFGLVLHHVGEWWVWV